MNVRVVHGYETGEFISRGHKILMSLNLAGLCYSCCAPRYCAACCNKYNNKERCEQVHGTSIDVSICVYGTSIDVSMRVHGTSIDVSMCVHGTLIDVSMCVHGTSIDVNMCAHYYFII